MLYQAMQEQYGLLFWMNELSATRSLHRSSGFVGRFLRLR